MITKKKITYLELRKINVVLPLKKIDPFILLGVV